MITVHHLENSRSQRVLWLLEELGLDYAVRRYARDPTTMRAPAALRAVHLLGKSPVITDGDATIAESGAIVEYLVERYGDGRLVPPHGSVERRRYTYWLHFAEGSAMPPLLLKLIFERLPRARMPALVRAKTGRIAGALVGLLTVMKGLPLAYAKDMQEDKEKLFDAAEAWALSLAAMAGMVRDLVPDTARMQAAAGQGFATATDLADWLVRVLGLPFRTAHHVTGRLVARAAAAWQATLA